MNYLTKKANLLKKSNALLLKSYMVFYRKVMNLSDEVQGFIDNSSEFSALEQLDLANFVANDETMQKLSRLACAMRYVENPKDKGIAFQLQDKIDDSINKKYTK